MTPGPRSGHPSLCHHGYDGCKPKVADSNPAGAQIFNLKLISGLTFARFLWQYMTLIPILVTMVTDRHAVSPSDVYV